VRPVNLLPARYRPRTGGASDSKGAYVALGALALLVLAVFGYALTASKVNSHNAEIAQTRAQIQATDAQVVTLKGFGDFAGVKQARLAAVKSLASERLDWERLFREMAHVLPQGVWLTKFSGSTAAPTGAGTDPGRAVTLTGCAESHEKIAAVMVRLREIHIAEDIELSKTSASENEDTQSAPAPAGPAGGESESGCGDHITFDVKVVLASTPVAVTDGAGAPVPARLGGGS
jgi:Tfp pilus assembly protein PilN